MKIFVNIYIYIYFFFFPKTSLKMRIIQIETHLELAKNKVPINTAFNRSIEKSSCHSNVLLFFPTKISMWDMIESHSKPYSATSLVSSSNTESFLTQVSASPISSQTPQIQKAIHPNNWKNNRRSTLSAVITQRTENW